MTVPEVMTPRRARAILGLPEDATAAEVELAFRRAIRVSHPDHGGEVGRAQLLLDARLCLRRSQAREDQARDDTDVPRIVIVPAATWRDHLLAVVARIRSHIRRPPSRVR